MGTDYFPKPTEEQISQLGPGCWVRADNGNSSFWVEISSVNDGIIRAEIREILNSEESSDYVLGQELKFRHNVINALGCDHFCFC
jgi:hypothetical protein